MHVLNKAHLTPAMRIRLIAFRFTRDLAQVRGNVYVHRAPRKLDPDDIDVCDCNPSDGRCCGDDSCLNRRVFVECIPGRCPCGDACRNQALGRRQVASVR